MDARRPCPDSALLAAFIDGTLLPDDRQAVVAHLTECGACRCTADNVAAFQEALERERGWESRAVARAAITVTKARPRRRWTREQTRVIAWTLAAAAMLAIVLYPPSPSTRESKASPVTELINSSIGARPITARVSDVAGYSPPPALDTIATGERGRWRLASAAGRLREAYEDDPGASAQHAVGVAALMVGRFDDAVSSLSRAAAADPSDQRIVNDLAAAYYERAVVSGHPEDLPRALSLVERVLASSPAAADGWFNRALIVTALGLHAQAREAWDAFLEKDSTSPWAAEARERRAAVSASPGASDWPALRQQLETTTDQLVVDGAVRRFASRVREYVDRDLLKAWASAVESGDDASAMLQRATMIASAFVRLSGDDTYADALAIVARAAEEEDAGRLRALARAHHDYGDGLRLAAESRVAEAAATLGRAEPVLAAFGSPLALRVRLEIAGTEYLAGRLDSAEQRVAEIEAAALAGDYANLVARVGWLHGLIGFARTDFGAAQIGYEEMLQAAGAAGDVEQVAFAHGLLANLHFTLGDVASAWRHRVEAADLLNDVSNAAVAANLLLSAAGDAATQGYHHAALVFQASVLGLGSINPILEVQTLAQRSRTLHQLGRHTEAVAAVEKARERVSRIPDRGTRDRLEPDLLAAAADVFSRSDPARAIAAAERALMFPAVTRDPLRVARFSQALAEALLQTNDAHRAGEVIGQGIAALAAFRNHPAADLRIGASDRVWSLFVRGVDLAYSRGDTAAAFELSEQRRLQTPIEHRRWRTRVISLAEFQRKLPAETAAVVFNQVEDRLYIWVVRPWGVRTHVVSITSARAASLIGAHLYEVAVGSPSPQVSGHLYDRLIKPVMPALAGVRNLAVIADAPYQRVAFAGLWNHRNKRFLVEDLAVVSSPSATVYIEALARGGEMSVQGLRAAVVIESPTDDAERDFDPRNRLNDRRVATLYPDAEVRRGAAATAKRLMNHGRPRDVIHVAAPLYPNNEFPFLSRLLLTDLPGRKYSGAVFAGHVHDTELSHARLVTLEPRDARSAPSDGHGTLGFSRMLLAAGVPNVVGPIAAVRAQILEQCWLEFHRHYAAGRSAGESLRQAQLTALSEANHRLGPWAMLTVFGSTQ